MGNLLDSPADIYDRAAGVSQQQDMHEVTFFASLLAPSPPALRVLDIGCAEGELSVALARAGHVVTAADISPRFLTRAADRARSAGVSVRTIEFDIERGEAAGESWDAVFFMDVLEHLVAPATALKHIRELLAPDGVAYVHTPNVCALSRVLHYALHPRRRFDYFRPEILGDLHLVLFDQMSLEKTMNLAGLRVTRIIPTFLTPPVIHRFGPFRCLGRTLARRFPHLADTLLFECRRAQPVDIDAAIAFWEQSAAQKHGRSR